MPIKPANYLNFYPNNPDIPILSDIILENMFWKQMWKYSPLFQTHIVYFLSDLSELELFSRQ